MKELLGVEVDENKYFEDLKSEKARATIKSEFRRMHGYKTGCFCKNCKSYLEFRYHNKRYRKCRLIGLSHSEATDIRKSDMACNLYKESEGE